LTRLILTAIISLLPLSSLYAAKENAADIDKYYVLDRGSYTIKIDTNFADWEKAENILVMNDETWEPLGGSIKNDKDLSAELRIVWDKDNLYFALQVKDDDYVAKGAAANHWENDGIQMAIDASAGKIPAGFPNQSTHLYNFSILGGWGKEAGPFLGDAGIEMKRDDAKKETYFEWRMPVEIFAKKGTVLKAGMEIAFAIIVNDSDEDAPGQTGWVGWGNHTIVFGKNPEEMKTIVLSAQTMAVKANGKLATTWGYIK